jgi:hypothetical protein
VIVIVIPLVTGGGAMWLVTAIAGPPTLVALVYQLRFLSRTGRAS